MHIQSYPDKKQYKTRYHEKVEQYNRRTTIYDHLYKLEKLGFVVKSRAESNGKRGRPKEYWEFNKEKIE